MADHGPPADLHTALALPLPILVICELLGVPYEDRDQFRGWSEAAGNVVDGELSMQGLGNLFGYGKELVARKRAAPGDDVISRLATTDGVSDDEAAMLSMTLLFAGHETTVVRIGTGALHLLANTDQWQALLDDPTLVPGAVEELLRASTKGGGGIPRYARTDLEIAGTTVLAGDLVLLDTGAANHDHTAFPDPDRLDVTRKAVGHLAFGHGLRYCIGTPLARIEMRSAFTQLLARFPTLRLDTPIEQLVTRHDTLTGGLTALPVTW
jgi:pentalenolactone synthase